MKIAICQSAGSPGRIGENLQAMARAAREAARRGARLVIFPELFLTGYVIGEKVVQLAEDRKGPSAREAAAIAWRTGMALLYGYPEKAAGRVYNAARLVDETGGFAANYRKTHLYGAVEKRLFHPGDRLAMAEVAGVKTAILICYDVEFPEAVRCLARAGAQLVAVPTALMRPHCRIARTVVPARAHENQLYVAYANRCGRETVLEYCGLSCVADPRGEDLARADTEPALLLADVEQVRLKPPVTKTPWPPICGRRFTTHPRKKRVRDGAGIAACCRPAAQRTPPSTKLLSSSNARLAAVVAVIDWMS